MSDPLGLIGNHTGRPASLSRAAGGAGGIGPGGAGAEPGPDFKDVLMKNLAEVNKLQQDAQMAVEDLASGRRTDMAAVVTAQQKADIAFQMLVQVRNKLMDAYEEIKQIRV